MFRLALVIPLISLSASAAATCIWTVQSTDKYFVKDPLYQEVPKIEREACTPDMAPICSGYAYCKVAGVPMSATGVACKAIKVDDKWRCPDAETCNDDDDIAISPTKIPGGASKPAGESPPPATTAE